MDSISKCLVTLKAVICSENIGAISIAERAITTFLDETASSDDVKDSQLSKVEASLSKYAKPDDDVQKEQMDLILDYIAQKRRHLRDRRAGHAE